LRFGWRLGVRDSLESLFYAKARPWSGSKKIPDSNVRIRGRSRVGTGGFSAALGVVLSPVT